ncbi:MAG: amidohydrolase [Rhodobacteraceae bacterium]|nr:MAG: amidohydrolase [Paracoccaceae bacterium]
MSKVFKVAAVQVAPAFLDLSKGVEKAIGLIEEAAAQDVKLIVFPEVWLPGYPYYVWLDSPAWSTKFVVPYFENSVEAGGAEDQALAKAARDNNIQISMGVSERDGSSLYIAQWHYDENGEIIKRRRKLKPTHVERTVYGEGDGSDLAVKDTSLGRIGQLSCWEHGQPLSKYAMYAQNEQIHCAAWPNYSLYRDIAYALGPEANIAVTRTYALEGSCFVISACAIVSKEMQEIICEDDAKKEAMLGLGGGFAKIFGPDGRSIGNVIDENEEGLVIAEIDLNMITISKAVADPAGHYSRPDVTRLLLNSKPQRPVMQFDETSGLVFETPSEDDIGVETQSE